MNQTRPKNRPNETLPSLREDFKQPVSYRRVTRTPQLKSKTPRLKSQTPRNKNIPTHKKTPLKAQISHQAIPQAVNSVIAHQKQLSLNTFSKQQPTLSSTTNIKNTDSLSKQSSYQLQINQLHNKLKQQFHLNNQLSNNFHQLKHSYSKKLKKYKVKNKLLKDQLKLLKWILAQRKDFQQVLEQLQIFKNCQQMPIIQQQHIQNNCFYSEKPNHSHGLPPTIDNNQIPSFKTHQPLTQVQTANSNSYESIQTSKNILTPKSSYQLQQQINILQQKVMELSIKNEFLQKLKIKPQNPIKSRYSFSNQYQTNPDLFTCQQHINSQQFSQNQPQNSKCKRMPLHLVYQNPNYSDPKSYQYSDDEDSPYKEKDKENPRSFVKQNCWNAALKQLRPQVESRYMSPLKERLIVQNLKESQTKKQISSRKQTQPQEQAQIQIPESRSKYCDSIKQRSRLLGL